MDFGTVSGLATAAMLAAFLGVVAWAYSSKRREDFERASRAPIEEEPR